jgi:hypothetical protein
MKRLTRSIAACVCGSWPTITGAAVTIAAYMPTSDVVWLIVSFIVFTVKSP